MKEKEHYNKYPIKSKEELKNVLSTEHDKYRRYMYKSAKDWALGRFKCENVVKIMRWQRLARLTDYHDYVYHTTGSKLQLLLVSNADYGIHTRCFVKKSTLMRLRLLATYSVRKLVGGRQDQHDAYKKPQNV